MVGIWDATTGAIAGTVSDRFSALRRSPDCTSGPGDNDCCGPASPGAQTAQRSKRENPERPRTPARKPPHPLPCLTCPSLPQLPGHPIILSVVVILNQSQGGCAFAGCWESGRESRGSVSALDCRTVRQRRLTSSFRLDSPARNLPTRSCTAALLPKHRLPVTSSLAQPQTASSALKSGL